MITLKEFFGQKIKIGNCELSHKNTAIAAGIITQMLLIKGSIGILDYPIYSISMIIYGFLIILPISYYNMRAHEKEAA